jgi:hypothetical protein
MVMKQKTSETKGVKKRVQQSAEHQKHYEEFLAVLTAKTKSENKRYYRVMTDEDRRYLSPGAFGYLSHLVRMGSVPQSMAEHLITFAYHIHLFTGRIVTKPMMDTIVNYHIFSGQEPVSVREFLSIVTENDQDLNWNEVN